MSYRIDLVDRMAADLGHERPHDLTAKEHKIQLFYAGLAEWMRVITTDIDPLMGSRAIGVSRDYLLERARIVHADLRTVSFLDRHDEAMTREQVQWMLDKLIFIGELWTPADNVVACTPEYPSGGYAYGKHRRMTGITTNHSDQHIYAGLCRFYKAEGVDEFCVDLEQGRLSLARYFLNGFYQIEDFDKLTAQEQRFLLCCCWPVMDELDFRAIKKWKLEKDLL